MRLMSFMLTQQPVLDKTKTVTRRAGWLFLKVGDIVQPVRKCMGMKPGESPQHLGAPIRITDIRREPLNTISQHVDYGFEECRLEGFGDHPYWQFPSQFVEMFCDSHKGCLPHTIITRIEFEYTE